jgi:hypothetical protein
MSPHICYPCPRSIHFGGGDVEVRVRGGSENGDRSTSDPLPATAYQPVPSPRQAHGSLRLMAGSWRFVVARIRI